MASSEQPQWPLFLVAGASTTVLTAFRENVVSFETYISETGERGNSVTNAALYLLQLIYYEVTLDQGAPSYQEIALCDALTQHFTNPYDSS